MLLVALVVKLIFPIVSIPKKEDRFEQEAFWQSILINDQL